MKEVHQLKLKFFKSKKTQNNNTQTLFVSSKTNQGTWFLPKKA
jgi:hypothetical protein